LSRTIDIVHTALFVIAISLPAIANLIGHDGADPEAENRELAALSDGLFPWFDDHFGFRSKLVTWSARIRYSVFGVSPSPSVVRGKNDWLFYGEADAIEDYLGRDLLTADGVRAWRDTVVRSRDWLRARDIAYVFTIAPDKHVIYPERFPESIRAAGTRRRMDQVFDAVAETGVAVDVRPALFAAKPRERLYHLTDSHWNARGVLPAYQAIIAALRAQDPAVPPAWERTDFEEVTQTIPGRDLARMMGLHHVLPEDDLSLVPRRPRRAKVVYPAGASPDAELGRVVTEIQGSTLPRAVIFRDSFATEMVPFLSEHFSRAVYLWQKDFVPQQVAEEGADVVIYEIAGRHLYNVVPSPELIAP
jgi:hypothetical protein